MNSRFKSTFIYSIIIGLIAHMYRLTNWMLCEDSTNYLDTISRSWTTRLGRYLLPFVENVRGTYELTWLLGLTAIICLSVTAGVIAVMFEIDGTIRRLLVAAIVVANPIVTSTFAYMYTADGYCFGLMLGTLFPFLINRKKEKKFIVTGILCMAAAMAFYQGFLTSYIMLIVIDILVMLMNSDTKISEIFKVILKNIICAAISMAIYSVGMVIAWRINETTTVGYMGIGEKPTLGLIRYWYAFRDCYVDFARVFLVRWKFTSYNVMNVIMFLLLAVIIMVVVIKNKLYKAPVRLLGIALILILLPVFTHIYEFMSEELSYSTTIMDYGTMYVFLIPIVLFRYIDYGTGEFREWLEKAFIKKHKLYCATSLLLILVCLNFIVISNKAYYNMLIANRNCEFLINRIEMRIEELEGYDEKGTLMIVGSRWQIPEYVTSAPMMTGVVSNIFLIVDTEYTMYMNKMLSTEYQVASKDLKQSIAETEEFKSMTEWPSKDSVKMIDGTMVVVLSYNDELYD